MSAGYSLQTRFAQLSAILAALSSAHTAMADSDTLEQVIVTASKPRSLDEVTFTGSRLQLTARETPGTLDTLDFEEMLGRGYATIEVAAAGFPGVITGGSPGDLADFSMRGFSGTNVTLLRNGVSVGPSNMSNRPGNTFNLAKIEVLKGPASVLFGQNAVGGSVNLVNKQPSLNDDELEFAASAGSFRSVNLGVGGNLKLNDSMALRADISRTSTDGYVNDADADSLNLTVSLLWQLNDDLSLKASLDYLKDHPSAYWGTPLVSKSFATQPLTGVISSSTQALDKRMRYINYNVADNRIDSEQYWPSLELNWKLNDAVSFNNLAYYFTAKRNWLNSEVYDFNPATNLIDRDRFFVLHDQKLYGDIATLTFTNTVFGRKNQLVTGIDYNHLDFSRDRGFPDGDSVNPFNPSPGVFGPLVQPGELQPRRSPTKWDSTSIFFEDALNLSEQLKLVTGGRYDRLSLDRKNYGTNGLLQAATSFDRDFSGSNWRIGLVYDVTANITPYISFTTGQSAAGANLLLVNAGQNFGLSDARQVEAGIKLSTADRRADLTAAIYDIKRKNLLTQINSAGDVSNIGSQTSRGVEVASNFKPLTNWNLSVNATYTDAKYGTFFDPDAGIQASGNTPANVPKVTANAWTSFSNVAGTGLELGGGVRYVGERYGDSGNTLKLSAYTLVDVFANYRLNSNLMLTSRIGNLFDKAYAQWADVFYPTEVLLGSPRRYEVGLVGKF